MAVAYRATGFNTGGSSSTSILSVPAATVAGDLLIGRFAFFGTVTVTPPAGWTLIRSDATSGNCSVASFWSIATSNGATNTATFNFSGAVDSGGWIEAFSGTHQTSPIVASAANLYNAAGTVIDGPSLQSNADGSALTIAVAANVGAFGPTFALPAGMTQGIQNGSGTNHGTVAFSSAYQTAIGIGQTGVKNYPISNIYTYRLGQSILIRQTNTLPNAPTLNYPIGNLSLDRGSPQRFTWTFSDPDPSDGQSQFDGQYRITGTIPWTAFTAMTPNQFMDFPAATFAAGAYEWQVRTYDLAGAVGPFSASAFFTAATAPAGPTITAPTNGGTIATASATLTWTYPTQSAYRVRKLADIAGAPDTATILFDSGEIASTSVRSLLLSFPVNNRFEHLQVQVRDSGSALLSVFSSVREQIAYSAPATPTVRILTSTSGGQIAVTAVNPTPTGSQPTVNSWDVYRRETLVGGAGIRIAAGQMAVFTDYTPASNVAYQYLIRANGSTGTTADSLWQS